METLYILFHNALVQALHTNFISISSDRKNLLISLTHTDATGKERKYYFDFKGEEIVFKIIGGIDGEEVKSYKTFKGFIEGLDKFVSRWSNPAQINSLLIRVLTDLTNGEFSSAKQSI